MKKQTLLLVVQSHISNWLAATALKGGDPEIEGEIAGAADSKASNSCDSFSSCDDSSDNDSEGLSNEILDVVGYDLVSGEENEQLSGSENSDEPVASAISFPNVKSSGRQVRSPWESRFVDFY